MIARILIKKFDSNPNLEGKTFDAVISDNGVNAHFFDSESNLFWYIPSTDFTVTQKYDTEPKEQIKSAKTNLVELIGGKPSRIEVEF